MKSLQINLTSLQSSIVHSSPFIIKHSIHTRIYTHRYEIANRSFELHTWKLEQRTTLGNVILHREKGIKQAGLRHMYPDYASPVKFAIEIGYR